MARFLQRSLPLSNNDQTRLICICLAQFFYLQCACQQPVSSQKPNFIHRRSNCLTAYGSHVSKLTTDWIHAHERTNLPTLAYKAVNKENNTYLLGNEDVLAIYNRLPRASQDHRLLPAGRRMRYSLLTQGQGDAPAGGGGECQQHCL